jgi:hypothetical protein
MKRCIQGVLCVLIHFGLATAAGAYVLPGRQILTLMIDQFGPGRTLVVFQKTVLYDPGLEGGMQELDETLYYRYPDRFRSEVSSAGVEQIRVVNIDGALTVVDGKIIAESESQFDHFKDLMLYKETDLLVEDLSQLGINIDLVSLGRFKDKIAYVIGAKYPDETVHQVWIDKSSFRPIRFILSGGEDTPLKEVEYTDYRQLDKHMSYPGRILIHQNGALVRMHVLETYEINAEVPEQLFDVTYLKSAYEEVASPPSTALPTSELDEVKRSIRDFKKIFE